jgi:hypothetical protein
MHTELVKINNDLIISGLTPGADDYALMKTSLDGEMQWIKTFGGESNDHCFAMDIANDNSIYLSGHTISGTENWDTYTMKIDQDGNKIMGKKKRKPAGFLTPYMFMTRYGILKQLLMEVALLLQEQGTSIQNTLKIVRVQLTTPILGMYT